MSTVTDNPITSVALPGTLKTCPRCQKEKDADTEFYLRCGIRAGYCKDCRRLYNVGWKQRNPDKNAEYVRRYQLRRGGRAGRPERLTRADSAALEAIQRGQIAFPCGFLLLYRADTNTYHPFPKGRMPGVDNARLIAEVKPVSAGWEATHLEGITTDETATVRRLVLRLKRERERGDR